MSERKRFCRSDTDGEMQGDWANSPCLSRLSGFITQGGLGGVVCSPHNESNPPVNVGMM